MLFVLQELRQSRRIESYSLVLHRHPTRRDLDQSLNGCVVLSLRYAFEARCHVGKNGFRPLKILFDIADERLLGSILRP
jgi:hypothetical protein